MASGANFGLRRSVPSYAGRKSGARVHDSSGWPWPDARVRGLAGPAHDHESRGDRLSSMAFYQDRAGRSARGRRVKGASFTFLQAAAFQWVNPKGWFMAVTALSLYAPSEDLAAILLVATLFAIVNLPSILLWTAVGQTIRRFLTSPSRLRAFNWGMAALLVASLALLI